MKSIIITALIFLNMTTTAQTNTAADTAQIRNLVSTMEEGWAKKDGNLFAKPFSENADYVIINGVHIKGKMAIAGGHQKIFDSFYKETFIKNEVQSICFIRPDIAIVHVSAKMTGNSSGKKVDASALISLTVEKTATGWQIDAFQNTAVE